MYYNILDFGGKGDSKTDSTEAIKMAINTCTKAGGGTVVIPAGQYKTGPIELKSNITLQVEAGAVVIFQPDFQRYSPVRTRWSGYECYGFSPLLYGNGLKNVTITGRGILEGQGEAWWDVYHQLKNGESYLSTMTETLKQLNHEKLAIKTNLVEWDSQFLRPPLLQLFECEHVLLEGVTLQNSPFWNTHLVYCHDVTVDKVTFKNPANAPNGDGLDLDSCTYVRVSNCHFDVGDDCLCLKSGINEDGRNIAKPTEHVTVQNCTMKAGHGGVVFGSENSGGIRNVTVSNCLFIGTDRGIRLKTNRARGGYIENILISNVYMEHVLCPFTINSFYRYGIDDDDPLMASPEAVEITEKTPIINHIHLHQITAKQCRAAAGFLYGLPEKPIEDVSLRHVTIEMTEDLQEQGGEPDMVQDALIMAGAGMFGKYIHRLTCHDVKIKTRQGPALQLEEMKNVQLDNVELVRKHDETPVIEMKNCEDVHVSGKQAEKEEYYLACD